MELKREIREKLKWKSCMYCQRLQECRRATVKEGGGGGRMGVVSCLLERWRTMSNNFRIWADEKKDQSEGAGEADLDLLDGERDATDEERLPERERDPDFERDWEREREPEWERDREPDLERDREPDPEREPDLEREREREREPDLYRLFVILLMTNSKQIRNLMCTVPFFIAFNRPLCIIFRFQPGDRKNKNSG